MIDCNNVLVLAYIGDAVYEVYIRNYLIKKNIVKVDKLQKEAVKYVSAKSQRVFLEKLINQNFFNQEEIAIIKRSSIWYMDQNKGKYIEEMWYRCIKKGEDWNIL